MNEAELKACPKCGAKPSTVSTSRDCWQTLCQNPECTAEASVYGITSEQSMRLWDERAGDREPAASKTPDESTLASATDSDAAPKIKHVFRLELTRKQAKQLREEWAANAEDGGMIIMQPGLHFGPMEVINVAAQCAILSKVGAVAVNNAIKPEKHQNADSSRREL